MHNPSPSGYYDRCPPSPHFRNWNEHGYTPHHYAKQHNGHHVRQPRFHHSSYHYDWHNHQVPPFHRPHYHSSPPSNIINKNWRHAHQQAVPKIIIQRSSIKGEKGKIIDHSSSSKSLPLYHVKTNSPAVSGHSSKDNGKINLPQDRKLLSDKKEQTVKKYASAVNEKLSELDASKPALNVVISNGVVDKEIKEVSSNMSEDVSNKNIKSNNPSDQQISSADTIVTYSQSVGYTNNDICLSKDSPNNISNTLTDRDNSERDESKDSKSDFSVEDKTGIMELNVGKSYNMKNCKRNSLVKLKKRYPELQKLFGKDPLIKLQRLSAAKIAHYEFGNSHESKRHILGSVSEAKGLELNKENKCIGSISVDPKVMSISRTLQKPPNGKKPVETIFKSTVSQLKSANPFPKSKRDAPKISYTDISKLKMKLQNIKVPRSRNISSKPHNIKSTNSIETKKEGSISLQKSSATSICLNKHSQDYSITKLSNKECNITSLASVTNKNETKMITCSGRTETEKCDLLGISFQRNTVPGQTLSHTFPAVTIRRDDQMQENGQIVSESIPSTSLMDPQVVSEYCSHESVEGQSSDIESHVNIHVDSLCDRTICMHVKEEITQKDSVVCINSASDLSKGTSDSESFDDRQIVDTLESKTPHKSQDDGLKSSYDKRQISGELHTSCAGNIDPSDLTALCSKSAIPERHKENVSCLPPDLDSSVTGDLMKYSGVVMDSTPHSAEEKLRSSLVLDSCANRIPVWQYNCSEEMLIAADTLLSVGSLPSYSATKTMGNDNYAMDKLSFYQTEYVTCPEETIGLDLTVNSNTTKDNASMDSGNAVVQKQSTVKNKCDTDVDGGKSLVKRKLLKFCKGENISKDTDRKHGEDEDSQACDSDATYIYSDSGEDSTMNQLIEVIQERSKDGSLHSGNSKKMFDLKKDSESTKHSYDVQKPNNGQKKRSEKSNYVVKNKAENSPNFDENNVSYGSQQKWKRKLSQDNDMVLKRKRASVSLKVVIGKVISTKVNAGQLNKNVDGQNGNDSGKIASESKKIKSKKAKSNNKILAEKNVTVRIKRNKNMKKADVTKDINTFSLDKSDSNFPDIAQSGFPEETIDEIQNSDAISTKTVMGTDIVSSKGKRLKGRSQRITRAMNFQKDKVHEQSAEEGKARNGRGRQRDRVHGQKTFTRVVKRHGKDLQIHLNEVLHHGEDSDDLPTILPPKRRRRPQHTTSHHISEDKMDRIMAEFPKHNWLITKYQSEPEDLSLCDIKKKVRVQVDGKAAGDNDSPHPTTVLRNPGTDQNENCPADHHEAVKDTKEDDEEDRFNSPLYIDMDSVNEKDIDEDSLTLRQHPLDLCLKRNDKASITFRQHSNPPVQLVHPHVHRPPTSGSFGQLSTVSSTLLKETKHALSSMVVSSPDISQGIVAKISTDWSTSAVSAMTETNDNLISEIIDLGKSIQVPENLLKHGAKPSQLCTAISDVQVLCDSGGKIEDVHDSKLESDESETKIVQPAIPRLIPVSSMVPGSNFSQHPQNHEIVLLPVSLGQLTDILPDVDKRQHITSNSQEIQLEQAVSMQAFATDISVNRDLLTSQDTISKVDENQEQLCPSNILCSSTVQVPDSSHKTNIVCIDVDSTAFTATTTIGCSSFIPHKHYASLSSSPSARDIESPLVSSHLSHGSASSRLSLSDGSNIKSNNTNTEGHNIFFNTTIPDIPEDQTKLEMKTQSSLTPNSEYEKVDAIISKHIKSLETDTYFRDNQNAIEVMDKNSVKVADNTPDITIGEPPMKKYCEYSTSKEPPPLMMVPTVVDAQSVSTDQNISQLVDNKSICPPTHNDVVDLDPEIQKQMEELEKKIQQNEKEKEEMLNAKRKMAELMERKKREKLEEQLKVMQMAEKQNKLKECVPAQTENGMQNPINHLCLSSFLQQESVSLQEPTSEEQVLPQSHSREKETPCQLQISLQQLLMKQNCQQQKQKDQQELTTDQQLVQVHTERFQEQTAPKSQNIHDLQQQNASDQWQQLSQQQRRSIQEPTLLQDKSALFQQGLYPDQMSQTSQVFLQHPPFTEQANLSSGEKNLPWLKPQQPLSEEQNYTSLKPQQPLSEGQNHTSLKPQQPLSEEQNHTSLKQMVQIQNHPHQSIQGSNVPRQQLRNQQLFSGQQPSQLAGNELQQQQFVSHQRFHLQSPLHMQPSQAAQTQSPAHLQHGFQNQYHPSLQQYSQTEQQNYYNHQAQLQAQHQFQQTCVKNQTQSLTHNITPPQSSIQNMQHPSMHHQHQMQQYQQIHMHQQPKLHLLQTRPSNFGNAFQMTSSQQHEVQSVVKQNSSHELMSNLNPQSKNVSPSSVIVGNANITPTVSRQITLAMQEAHKRKQFGLREIKPAHCNNENSLRRRDSEPPPPAHMNCVSLKKLLRKIDRNAVKMTSAMEASCPYLQRNEPITCPPSDVKISGGIEMKALTKAHSQPPFNIAGKLIVQQLPGKTPSINRPNNEDKETARHSSIPNTPTSASFGVQLPPRASSASDRYSHISQSILEVNQPAITFHPNSPSSASLSRSSSSLQAFTNLSKPEESKLTDKNNTVSFAILNSHQTTEGSIKFTSTPQTIQSHDAVATTNLISQTNIIDLTKEGSTVQNLNLQKDDTEKAVQLELNKAIAKRCKQDLLNASITGDDLTQSDQQPSKIPQQMHGMKLPIGTSNTIVLTVDNQPHVQQASLHVSPVLVSTPIIQNQQQQWQKQLLKSQGPDSMMRPSPGMHFNTVSNMQTMQTPSNRITSGQGGRLPQLQPKVQNSMIRMIGSAAVPINGVRMPPTAENMQINRPHHPQAMMMQGSYRLNQQHSQAQREYQNPEIMKHRTRQYIGAPRSGLMLPHQIPLHSSKEVSQDCNSFHQHPALNPSIQTNAFNQDRQEPKQITPASQAFVPMSYQRQLTNSQASFASLVSCTTVYGHGQHVHTQNSMMTENEQLPNRHGNVDNTVPQKIPVNSTSQRAQIIPTSSTETTIPPQTITSVVPSEHPITSKTNNDIFHTEVDPTSKKTEAHLQQINGSCVMCGNFSLYLCSCCKKMWYCSPQCQLQHWTTHSQECRESTAT